MARRSAIGIFNGNWKNRWRRDLEGDQSDRRVYIIEKNKEKFGDALACLKTQDPDGWEVWFDDDANIPPIIWWMDSALVDELCKRMEERAKQAGAPA